MSESMEEQRRLTPPLSPEQQIEKMRRDWDARARENARHYVNTAEVQWTDEEFFASGERTVAEEILTDMINICQGKEPKQMRVLEIGCGAGRVTRALAKLFGEVYGVDISGEMVERARKALAGFSHAHVFQNNGSDLAVIPAREVDFAFSTIVFQHIPSYEIIESYVRDVCRLLRPGGLFKFQVQGGELEDPTPPDDSWNGVSFTPEQAKQMAENCGFEMRYGHGAGGQYYWLWFFKKP